MAGLPEHVRINRDAWTASNAAYTDANAHDAWSRPEITWGVWGVPESDVHALPDVAGLDVIELGCGTAFLGAGLKRSGARRVVGIDVTPAQLVTAQRCEREFQLGMEFIEASAENVPVKSARFDLAVSEYGASIWCDPELWLAEAARLLRPGGELVFLRNSTVSMLCTPDAGPVREALVRPQRGMYRLQWTDDDPGVEFHPSTGDLLRLLRRNGFEILDLIELYPPEGAQDHSYYVYVPTEWAGKWCAEEVWRARLVD
jgi:SAM-dependent methyltransferase